MDMTQLFQPNLPPDISAQAGALSRKQQILEALLQRGVSPMQMPQQTGRLASPASPFAALAQLAQTAVAAKGLKGVDEEGQTLAQKYNQSMSDVLSKAQQLRNSGDEDGANALLLTHPTTRQLGLDMMKRRIEIQTFTNAAGRMNGQQGGAPAAAAEPPPGVGTVLTPEASEAAMQAPQAAQGGGAATGIRGFGGPAGGIPMAAWLAADPTGAAYSKALAEENAPKPLREGDLVQRDANGNYVSRYQQPKLPPGMVAQRDAQGQAIGAQMLPGAVEGQANVAGAEAGAKAAATNPYEIVNVTQADGSVRPTYKYLVPGYPNAAKPGAGALPGAGLGLPPPTLPSGGSNAPVPVSSGPKAEGVWATIPKRLIPKGIGQSTYNETIAKEQGQQAVKMSSEFNAAAEAANQRIALNDQALSLLDKADTGAKAALISDIKNYLIKFVPGLDPKHFDPTATQELQKDLVNAATQRAKQQFGPRITQSEVMLMLTRGAPNVDMTKAAIEYLVKSDSAQSQYAIDQADHFGTYVEKGGDPGRFGAWHAKAFPMTDELKKIGYEVPKKVQSGKIPVPTPPTKGGIQVFPPAMKPPVGLEGWHVEVDAQGNRAWVDPTRKQFREIE